MNVFDRIRDLAYRGHGFAAWEQAFASHDPVAVQWMTDTVGWFHVTRDSIRLAGVEVAMLTWRSDRMTSWRRRDLRVYVSTWSDAVAMALTAALKEWLGEPEVSANRYLGSEEDDLAVWQSCQVLEWEASPVVRSIDLGIGRDIEVWSYFSEVDPPVMVVFDELDSRRALEARAGLELLLGADPGRFAGLMRQHAVDGVVRASMIMADIRTPLAYEVEPLNAARDTLNDLYPYEEEAP